jgi:hypothetical protein
MHDSSNKKERLERLLDLAQVYRSWTRKELAAALGRDPTKLVPGSGNPKLDLVVQLADALDWSIGDVTDCLINDFALQTKLDTHYTDSSETTFEYHDGQAREAHAKGKYREMIQHANRSMAAATTPTERALACNRELGGWDGLGRYARTLDAAQRGLRENSVDIEIRRALKSNLANAYYTLWHLVESRATALELLHSYREEPPTCEWDRCTLAFAQYVLGHTHRRLIDAEPEHAARHAEIARTTLHDAAEQCDQLAQEVHESYDGISRTCRGGIMEAEVALGSRDARSALAEINDGLNEIIDLDTVESGDVLESFGWWCIFGCNIAIRHISDERDLHRTMALFTNKADEIANRLDNWSMRERVFTLQYTGHQRFVGWTGQTMPMTIDSEDIKMITGTMGRFPQFRKTGGNILQTANVVQSS